jgi:hypothetical protein
MNAIAFTREVLAVFGEPRRMVIAAILRGSQALAPQDDDRIRGETATSPCS